MKLYIGYNGDMSYKIYLFAPDKKTARKLAKKKIKEEELESFFPVLDFDSYKPKEGVIEVSASETNFFVGVD